MLTRQITPVLVGDGPIELRVEVDFSRQQFFWRHDRDWQKIGPVLNAAVLSDEGGRGEQSSFTGAFVGMVAFDTTGLGREARFAKFSYDPA